jgi:hypothetical protein
MPKLGELLSGILSDLAQSRVVADAASREILEAYAKDPILAQVPAPRVTIKDVTLKLRFAVAEHQTTTPEAFDEAGAATAWRQRLTAAVLTPLVRNALAGDRRRDQADDFAAALIAPNARVQFRLGDAVAGRVQHTVESTVDHLLVALKKLPADMRKQLPAEATLRRSLNQAVRTQLDDFANGLRLQQTAREGARTRLDVLVRPADLKEVQESALQEITLTLAIDDVVRAEPPPAQSKG